MISISLAPIPVRIAQKKRDLADLLAYPETRLATIIKEVGFHCDCCAKCCTKVFNDHVFLLDRDVVVIRELDPSALVPAPFYEFCDHKGTFYVSGYALRSKNDDAGSCHFLAGGRCRIYDRRLSICRIYPYMLHREPDEQGVVDWRQIAGIDLHGEFHTEIPDEECQRIARETKEYEEAFLRHEIAFLEFMRKYFTSNRIRHVQKVYDNQMRKFWRGEEINVMVYCTGRLEPHNVVL